MHGEVVEKRWLSPSLLRIVLGGGDLGLLEMVEATDAYVNLAFPPVGAPYGPVFEPAEVRRDYERRWWPARRRYTVRSWHAEERTLTLDFVVHGDTGVAGPWAVDAEPGDLLVLEGPSGGYRPDPEADWLLMVGDESAVPAVSASLERIPLGMRAVVILLCDGKEHELDLESRGDVSLTWLHRTGIEGDTEILAEAVRRLTFPSGRPQAFIHGEATQIRALRRHLLMERELMRQDMSCSPYWRREMTDEAWREVKRDFVQKMEDETDPARSGT